MSLSKKLNSFAIPLIWEDLFLGKPNHRPCKKNILSQIIKERCPFWRFSKEDNFLKSSMEEDNFPALPEKRSSLQDFWEKASFGGLTCSPKFRNYHWPEVFERRRPLGTAWSLWRISPSRAHKKLDLFGGFQKKKASLKIFYRRSCLRISSEKKTTL